MKQNEEPELFSDENWKPLIFANEEFESQKNRLNLIEIRDLRLSLYKELFKLSFPEITSKHKDFLSKSDAFIHEKISEESAVWVYYPWKKVACCIPGKEDFVKIRTSRNQYKLTPEEQAALSQKKVGIIGLSVGQTIAVTMAMERSATEFRLADFDELELSNINRLRSGIHNIGLKKVVIAAREIAEIDPFIVVKIFPAGITRKNLDQFLLDGGKLDLLVDECDGLDIKILARHRARELKIPVLMDTSDRGMLDVERFDLEPERPILHGLAGDLNPDRIAHLTNEEKIPYILDMVDAENMSTRLKASMLEVQQTINTWPQLASSVFLGGALGADTARRIFLNQFTQSGRYYVDFEQLIADKKQDSFQQPGTDIPASDDWNVVAATLKKSVGQPIKSANLSDAEIDFLVRSVVIAPSGGNVQPWHWMLYGDEFFLFIDRERAHSFLDIDHLGTFIAHGAALQNFRIAAKALGLEAEVSYICGQSFHSDLLARITVKRNANEPVRLSDLENLFERHTNRLKGSVEPIDQKFFEESFHCLSDLQQISVLQTREHICEYSRLTGVADRIRLTVPWAHSDFMKETRWNDAHARSTGDGIDIETLELTRSDVAAFRILKDWNTLKWIADWGLGSGLEKLSRETTERSGAIMMVYSAQTDPENMVRLGETIEKIWILAAKYRIGFQPVSPITFLIYRNEHYPETFYKEWQRLLLHNARQSLFDLFQLPDYYRFGFVFRLFKSDKVAKKSYRLPLHQVFTHLKK
ncbi:Rv1355c family protein [Schleiferia thermophila]|jgi:molybdopterin/thiamine biosynthesis adenylyltransferase|uniref:Rv1355c family protein n=1 Tax=Schleiferia thermophila TaxID=884107 RepID=UPI003EEB70BB